MNNALLLAQARGAPPNTQKLFALYNGTVAGGNTYRIGYAESTDHMTWTTTGSPCISPSAAWESTNVTGPSLLFDGTQFVCFYDAGNGVGSGVTNPFQIGRATAQTPRGSWSKYGSNPIIALGGTTAPDRYGCAGPVAYYSADLSPAWKLWYTGIDTSGVQSVCFADSTDGLTWTKRGKVLGSGSAGTFNSNGISAGGVFLSGSTFYLYIAGFDSNSKYHGGWVTCTDPANSATYTAPTVFSNYSGTVTVGGKTWQKNVGRAIFKDGTSYRCYLTLFDPTDTSTILETSVAVTSPDLTSWGLPSALMLPYESWSTVSAENATVMLCP